MQWEAELDEDLQDVDLNLAIGNYGQNIYNPDTSASDALWKLSKIEIIDEILFCFVFSNATSAR